MYEWRPIYFGATESPLPSPQDKHWRKWQQERGQKRGWEHSELDRKLQYLVVGESRTTVLESGPANAIYDS